jgi:outer membrane murein-binding lipoprotein Lpp
MNTEYRTSNIEYRKSNVAARRFAFNTVLLCSCALAALVAGCESSAIQKNPLAEKVDKLSQEKRELMRHIEHIESTNKDLQKQINTLHGLEEDVKLKDLCDLQSVRITKHTNLFDKDKNGTKETLIVYIQPIDQDGDIIKAPGDVHVQLLDLDKDKDPALLGKWHITPSKLRKLWFNTLLKTHYRLTFDVSDKVENPDKTLTVMLTFTDYLTGKVFEEQKLIKPL